MDQFGKRLRAAGGLPETVSLAPGPNTIRARAVDSLGPIARLEYAVDGGTWRLFFPSDDQNTHTHKQTLANTMFSTPVPPPHL